MAAAELRPLTPADEAAASALLDEAMGGRHQARLGEAHDVLALPGAGAWDGDVLLGVATWTSPDPAGRTELAVVAVAAGHRGRGVGGALVEEAAAVARRADATVQWLSTTNDNLDALRLYQRHGYRLVALHAGWVDEARRLKPTIPTVGEHGIPLRDELVLDRPL